MARKKASGQKSASKTETKSTNKATGKTTSAKKPKVAAAIDEAEIRAEIDQLATRTLALWREQMTALAQSPRAMQDMTKLMEPVFSLFTRGFDMWLMMLDQFAKTVPAGTWADGFASPGTPAASGAAKPASKNSNAAARTTQKPAAKSAGSKKKPASRAKTAAPASDTSGTAVAELAKRLATLKQQGERVAAKPAATAASSAPAARVGKNQATVASLADARSRSRRKA